MMSSRRKENAHAHNKTHTQQNTRAGEFRPHLQEAMHVGESRQPLPAAAAAAAAAAPGAGAAAAQLRVFVILCSW